MGWLCRPLLSAAHAVVASADRLALPSPPHPPPPPPTPLQEHENKSFFPGFPLPADTLSASGDIREVARHGEVLLMVIPTPFVERTVGQIADVVDDRTILVSCTKGEGG